MNCQNKNKVKIKIDYIGILKQDTSTLFSENVGGGIRTTEILIWPDLECGERSEIVWQIV